MSCEQCKKKDGRCGQYACASPGTKIGMRMMQPRTSYKSTKTDKDGVSITEGHLACAKCRIPQALKAETEDGHALVLVCKKCVPQIKDVGNMFVEKMIITRDPTQHEIKKYLDDCEQAKEEWADVLKKVNTRFLERN